MYALERLKELAVNQMRAAADLYEVCEKAEQVMAMLDDDNRNKTYLRAKRNCRYMALECLLGLKPTDEEKELWDDAMEELD